MSDTLSFRYFQFSGLSHELIDNPSRKGETQCYSCQRLMPPYLRWLHTHSSARTQRGLETRIQHSVVLSSYPLSSTLSPRPFPFMGKGGSGGYTPAALPEIAQPGQAVKGKPPQTAGVPPLDCPFPAALQNIRRRGIYHHRAHPRRGAFTSGQSVQKRGPVTSPSPFSCPAAPVRAAISLSTRPAAP